MRWDDKTYEPTPVWYVVLTVLVWIAAAGVLFFDVHA